jgi:undecaprenyl pyrophosphate phosphatase UppP
MTTHLGVMIVFAACVAIVFGTLLRDTPRDELRLAVRIFGGLIVGAYVVGWIMYITL